MSMPETNKRKNLDVLRVYAPSRGNLAIDMETLPRTHVAEPVRKPAPRHPRPYLVPEKAPEVRRRTLADILREYKVAPKLGFVALAVAVAFAFIVMLSGYNDISAAQKRINALDEQVSRLQSAVEKTKVDYLFSIDLGSAREAATQAGMTYPAVGSEGR